MISSLKYHLSVIYIKAENSSTLCKNQWVTKGLSTNVNECWPFARNLREFGVARSEELEVNQWVVQDIHWLSSQSERPKNTIHCFSIH